MKTREFAFLVAGLLATIGVGGCAQTTVSPERESIARGLPKPGVILVHKFAVNSEDVWKNRDLIQRGIDGASSLTPDEQMTELANEVAEAMAERLVEKIGALGLPARRTTTGSYVPADALVIAGQFVTIDEGNRTQRLLIGFGAGASRVDANVFLLAPRNGRFVTLAEFTVNADSGKMPGAAVTMGAGAAAQGGLTAGMAVANVAASGVKGYRSEVANMAARSADKAAEYLADIFVRQGWISPDKVK